MSLILIDYLVISMPLRHISADFLIAKLNLNQSDFTDIKSYYGLTKCLYFGGVHIHWHDDISVDNPLIILDMSGKGCRLVETSKPDIDWINFIESFMRLEGAHIARLDVACDDKPETGKSGFLSFSTMVRHLKQRKYISLARKKIFVDGDEQNIIFGSSTSDRRLRIYNKALERGYDGHWIRVEFQLRNDTALSFFMRALELHDVGRAYYGMLYDYLRFTKEVNNDDGNQSRLTVCRWWQKFCNYARKIKGFYLGGMEYNRESLDRYISTQTASSIQTFLTLNDNDFQKLLQQIGNASINKKQEFLIKTHFMTQKMIEDYE